MDANTCTKCPKGKYQDQSGQGMCKNCSDGYTTQNFGARNATECVR